MVRYYMMGYNTIQHETMGYDTIGFDMIRWGTILQFFTLYTVRLYCRRPSETALHSIASQCKQSYKQGTHSYRLQKSA